MSRKGTMASLKSVGRKHSTASDTGSVVGVPELATLQPVVPEPEEKKEAVQGTRRAVYVNIVGSLLFFTILIEATRP